MTPIINPWLFYIVDVIDNLKFECLFIPLLFLLYIVSADYADEDLNEEKTAKTIKKIVICVALLFTAETLLPSKETCYKMMVASQITDNNIQKAEDTIKKSVDYIFEKINEK